MRKSLFQALFTLIAAFFISLPALKSQTTQPFNTNQGDQLLHLGIGFLNPEAFTFSIFSASGGGNPSISANLSYQYAAGNKFLIGAFASYYRVNANYNTSFEELEELFTDITFDDIINNIDCIVLGNCSTTITQRVSVYTIGLKLSYIKTLSSNLETYVSGYLGYSYNRRKTITESALNLISEELDLKVEVPTFIYYSSVGLRYYLKPRLALQCEYGYGNSHLLNVGLTYKLARKHG